MADKCDRCGKRYRGKNDIFPPHWAWLILNRHDAAGVVIHDETETAMLCDDCADSISAAIAELGNRRA